MHEQFEARLDRLVEPASQVGQEAIAEVLSRVSLRAPSETSRIEIAVGLPALGAGHIEQRPMPQGTVSKAVKALIKDGLLEDGETLLRNGDGRVLSPLRLGRSLCIAGAKVTLREGLPFQVTTALVGLDSQLLLSSGDRLLSDLASDPWETVAQVLHEQIIELQRVHTAARAEKGLNPLELFGVGVEVGTLVRKGHIIRPTGVGWHGDAPLADTLIDLFGHNVPVVVENDVNALAVLATHETLYTESDLVVVSVFDEGVGGGLIMDGQLRRGGNGMAMEIGHLTVGHAPGQRHRTDDGIPTGDADPSLRDFDDRCPCGAVGHLDAFATPKRIRALLGVSTNAEAAKASARAKNGKTTRQYDVFWKAGAVLGRGLAHVINIVDPNRLILCLPAEWVNAPFESAAAAYRIAAEEEMRQHSYSSGAKDAGLTLRPVKFDELSELGVRAAAICVLNSFIEHAKGLDGCHLPQRRPSHKDPVTRRRASTNETAA